MTKANAYMVYLHNISLFVCRQTNAELWAVWLSWT